MIGHHHPGYATRRIRGDDPATILNELEISLMCCRRMFISHVESLTMNHLEYPNRNIVLDRGGTTLLRESIQSHEVSCD